MESVVKIKEVCICFFVDEKIDAGELVFVLISLND
jgi:hypothetical protein